VRFIVVLLLAAGILGGCGSNKPTTSEPAPSTSSTTVGPSSTTETSVPAKHDAGPTGATGPAGPTGPAGTPGTPGARGISGYEAVHDSKTVNVNNSAVSFGSVDVSVACPAGKSILTGGATIDEHPQSTADFAWLARSAPVGTSWAATAYWSQSAVGGTPDRIPRTMTLTVDAICAVVG
jgi:hypothetical protein